jgi:hypothetical protein
MPEFASIALCACKFRTSSFQTSHFVSQNVSFQ